MLQWVAIPAYPGASHWGLPSDMGKVYGLGLWTFLNICWRAPQQEDQAYGDRGNKHGYQTLPYHYEEPSIKATFLSKLICKRGSQVKVFKVQFERTQ